MGRAKGQLDFQLCAIDGFYNINESKDPIIAFKEKAQQCCSGDRGATLTACQGSARIHHGLTLPREAAVSS